MLYYNQYCSACCITSSTVVLKVEYLENFPDFWMYRELGLQVALEKVPAQGMEFEEGGMGLLLY